MRELEALGRQQAAIAALGLRALADAGAQTVAEEASAAVARCLEVDLALVTEVVAGSEELLLRAAVGWPDATVGEPTAQLNETPVREAISRGAPVRCRDLRARLRHEPSSLLERHGLVSGVAVAIKGRERAFGALGAFARRRRDFAAADVDFMQALANVIAAACELETGQPRRNHRAGGVPARVLLVTQHAAAREAIADSFSRHEDLTVVAEAGSLNEAREMLSDVDVAVISARLPDGFGPDLIAPLHRANPDAHALVLSTGLDAVGVARAVAGGAAAVVSERDGLDDVLDALRRLRAGETILPREETARLVAIDRARREREQSGRRVVAALTDREVEIMRLIADGLDTRAIAGRLCISERTERNHVASILAKLGVHSRLQALLFCARYGVVEVA